MPGISICPENHHSTYQCQDMCYLTVKMCGRDDFLDTSGHEKIILAPLAALLGQKRRTFGVRGVGGDVPELLEPRHSSLRVAAFVCQWWLCARVRI